MFKLYLVYSIGYLIGGSVILAVFYFVLDRVYSNIQLHINSKKIKNKKEEIRRRKARLKERLGHFC